MTTELTTESTTCYRPLIASYYEAITPENRFMCKEDVL